jgi:fructan beta-fructosidase
LLIGYDDQKKQFYVDRRKSGNVSFADSFTGVSSVPFILKENTIEMHLVIDATSVEMFAQKGMAVLTDIFYPTKIYDKISVFAEGGKTNVPECKVWKLNDTW